MDDLLRTKRFFVGLLAFMMLNMRKPYRVTYVPAYVPQSGENAAKIPP